MSLLALNSLSAERMRGCVFAERFENEALVEHNGGEIFGTPVIDFGAKLNGTTDYIKYLLNGELDSAKLTFHLEFYPEFAADDDIYHLLCDTSTVGGRWFIGKTDTNTLVLYGGATPVTLIQVALGNFGSYWIQNGRNVLSATVDAVGANALCLNGHLIGSSAIAWVQANPSSFYAGASNAGGSPYSGILSRLYIGQHTSTLQEHLDIWNHETWDWESRLVVNLRFGTQDLDPVSFEGADVAVNGDFSVWTDPTVPDDWGKSGTHDANNYVEESGGGCRLVSDGTLTGISQVVLIIGETYKIKVDVTDATLGSAQIAMGVPNLPFSSVGSFELVAVATAASLAFKRGSACDITIDDLEVLHMASRTLDSSGHNNHATLGDGVTPATYPTQGAGRMEGDGAQYLQTPADATLPAGTYTVLMANRVRGILGGKFLFDARTDGGIGYAYIDPTTGKIILSSGALFINGEGPYTSNFYIPLNDVISTMVFQGITLNLVTLLAVFCRYTFVSILTGTFFDFKIVPGTANQTQIFDYHSRTMRRIGTQI